MPCTAKLAMTQMTATARTKQNPSSFWLVSIPTKVKNRCAQDAMESGSRTEARDVVIAEVEKMSAEGRRSSMETLPDVMHDILVMRASLI